VRILLIDPGPAFSVRDVYTGWRDAFRQLGCQVAEFNLGDRCDFYTQVLYRRDGEVQRALDDEQALRLAMNGIKAACYEFWPDVVLVVSAFYIPKGIYDLLRSRRHKLGILHTEEPYEHDRQLERASWVDFNLINDPTNLDAFVEVNPYTWYVPHAYDPAIHCPGPADPDLACDFAFVGTGYPSRMRFFETVDWRDWSVTFAGNWQWTAESSPLRRFLGHDLEACLPNHETVRLYRSCKASANLYRREAERPELSAGWAMGPREVELAATETFFLRESRREGDDILNMFPIIDDPAGFGETLGWWLARDDAREKAARAAREAIADRTFVNNARQLLQLIER
jgi:hypothetical protein